MAEVIYRDKLEVKRKYQSLKVASDAESDPGMNVMPHDSIRPGLFLFFCWAFECFVGFSLC